MRTFRKLDRDKVAMFPRDVAASLAHRALVPLNRLEGEALVVAMAILFAGVCHRVQLDPQEVHALGLKMLRDQPNHRQANDALQSLKDFAGIQVAGEPNVEVA